MRTRALTVACLTVLGGLAMTKSPTRLNPLIELLDQKRPIFGLYAPANPRARPGAPAPDPAAIKSPAQLAQDALAYVAADYIFDGSKPSPYDEEDAPHPLGAYGRSKLAGDTAIQQVGGRHLIFRLCWVYGARGSNFMLTMMRLAREREQLKVVHDQIGCPTPSRLIAETTALALQQVRATGDMDRFTGTYHLCCAGQTSWHGFASAIIGHLPAAEHKCREILAVPSTEYPTPTQRPAYSVMTCGKLHRTFGLALPDWQDSLRLVLDA